MSFAIKAVVSNIDHHARNGDVSSTNNPITNLVVPGGGKAKVQQSLKHQHQSQ